MHFRATGSDFEQRSDIFRLEDKGSLDEPPSVRSCCDPRHSSIWYVANSDYVIAPSLVEIQP